LLLTCVAGATSVPQLSFEELIDHSDLIVSGQVTRSWAEWDSEHKFIWTHYEVAVSAAHKGTPGATAVVSEVGGIVGDRGMSVAGTVGYQTGEKVLVFLTRVPNGYLRTTGWGQGKYTVDEKNILHASASLRSIEIVQGKGTATGTPIRTLEGMSSAELHNRIAARLRSQQPAQGSTR
jgi:hypothetical protein